VDDGVGFDPRGEFPGHLGLKSMAERAETLGGSFAIESIPGAGTTIRVAIPTGKA
jgi:signal transduction histidine kinase